MFTLFPCDNNWVLLNSHGLKMCYLIEINFCANKSSHFLSDTWSLFIFFFLWRMCLPECNSNTTFFVTPSPLCLPSSPFDYIPSGVNMVRFSFTAGERSELPRGGWWARAQGLRVSIQLSSFSLSPHITCYLTILRVNSSYFSNIMCNYNSMLLNILTLKLLNSHMILLPLHVLQFQELHVTYLFKAVSLMAPFYSFLGSHPKEKSYSENILSSSLAEWLQISIYLEIETSYYQESPL